MIEPTPVPETTDGHLLGGRVRYRQPAHGFRTGIEPVLLAASIPARPGQIVVEAGTGAGAGLLCLASRVPGLRGVGVELDPALAAIAADNLSANGFSGIAVQLGRIEAWKAAEPFDHAFANPPWHAASGSRSPSGARDRAKAADPALIARWAIALGARLRPQGTLSLILPAAQIGAGIAALRDAVSGSVAIVPLWPRLGAPAKLAILRGIRLGRSFDALLPGLVLHDEAGRFTPEADRVLRDGQAL